MQPLQYELRCPAAKDNSIAHAAAAASNLDAAISLWSATRDLTSAKNYAHVAEHQGRTDYARNDRSRARRTQEVPFIAGCSQFTRKNTRFGAPASSPKQSPCIKIHAAITMRFAAARANSFSTPPLPLVSVTILRRHPLQQHMHIQSARHHLPWSPLPLVTRSLSHHPASAPFVSTLRHYFPQSPPFVAFCYEIYCDVMYWYGMYCYVMYCFVMYCSAWCICIVSQYLTILFTRNSEDCFPTSFDQFHNLNLTYVARTVSHRYA